MSLPYLYTETIEGDTYPWLASQTDILATDWESVSEQVQPKMTFDEASKS